MTIQEFKPYTKITARFNPKNIATLRFCMIGEIGKVYTWNYAGRSDDDEEYPGQTRWMPAREHDNEMSEECRGYWCPEEDLEIVDDEDASRF